jgi:hypothetical protein
VSDVLFDYVLEQHGNLPMRSVLDAGTGRHSLTWVQSLAVTHWCAVTGDPSMAHSLRDLTETTQPPHSLIVDNWSNPELLSGQQFDLVLADYLLGALDAFAPYYQDVLFERLRPHVGKRLYVIGLEPLPDVPDSAAAAIVTEVARARDAILRLCNERCYREYPSTWIRRQLERSGYRVVSEKLFANVLRRRWIDGQIDMCTRRLQRLPHTSLRTSMAEYLEDLRARAYVCCDAQFSRESR